MVNGVAFNALDEDGLHIVGRARRDAVLIPGEVVNPVRKALGDDGASLEIGEEGIGDVSIVRDDIRFGEPVARVEHLGRVRDLGSRGEGAWLSHPRRHRARDPGGPMGGGLRVRGEEVANQHPSEPELLHHREHGARRAGEGLGHDDRLARAAEVSGEVLAALPERKRDERGVLGVEKIDEHELEARVVAGGNPPSQRLEAGAPPFVEADEPSLGDERPDRSREEGALDRRELARPLAHVVGRDANGVSLPHDEHAVPVPRDLHEVPGGDDPLERAPDDRRRGRPEPVAARERRGPPIEASLLRVPRLCIGAHASSETLLASFAEREKKRRESDRGGVVRSIRRAPVPLCGTSVQEAFGRPRRRHR